MGRPKVLLKAFLERESWFCAAISSDLRCATSVSNRKTSIRATSPWRNLDSATARRLSAFVNDCCATRTCHEAFTT
ncbi:MAG: hypothetical protein CNCCGFBP_01111 [Fimbriimonadaceae bacterium]|nr:hypothetical protein [Fimbriimonadaceae bacterium]